MTMWLRDTSNTWQSELRDGKSPLINSGLKIDLKSLGISDSFHHIDVYDPWNDVWINSVPEEMKISLPDFKRSLVVRIKK